MSSRNVVDLRKRKPGAHLADQAPLPLGPQKRVSPVRARRKRMRVAASSLLAASVIAGACALSYASYLPRYSVASVDVEGARAVPQNAIADYAESIIYDGSHHFFSRANVLLYPKALIEHDIPLEFPRIASATVAAPLLSNSVTIDVVERQPFALWCEFKKYDCYSMDSSGFIFAQAPAGTTTPGVYVFSGGTASSSPIGQTFAAGHTQGLVAFLQLLAQSGYQPLGASVQNDLDFSVPLSRGYSVYASFGENPGTLVSDLDLVLSSNALAGQEQNLEYVDLRFGNKVYYKLKSKDQTQATSTPQ